MTNEDKLITPKTKLIDILNNHPELEEVLMEYNPAFKKLKNPVLRKTVARIASLKQVASVGGVKVEELINLLRRELGQKLYDGDETSNYNFKKPDWFDENKIVNSLDISEMLEAGDQPVNQVLADIKALKDGGIYELKAPFLPAPVIDKSESLRIKHWIHSKGKDEFYIYFFKA